MTLLLLLSKLMMLSERHNAVQCNNYDIFYKIGIIHAFPDKVWCLDKKDIHKVGQEFYQ